MDKKIYFHEKKYKNYKALSDSDSFFKDKVYLYKIFRFIEELNIKDIKETKILEIGCADGSFIKVFKDKGYDVYGIDISQGAIKRAKQLGIMAFRADADQRLEFDDNSFDIIIAAEIIEHLYDTDYFLNEMYRVTKPGGYLFLTTPNLASLKNRVRLLLGKYPQYLNYRMHDDSAGHIRNYTVGVLRSQLVESRWEVVKIVSPNIIFPMIKNLPLLAKRIAMYLGDIFYTLGSHIIIKAKK